MPTKIVKEVWVADDGSEHASESDAVVHEQREAMYKLFKSLEYVNPYAIADDVLNHGAVITRILAVAPLQLDEPTPE